MRYFIIMKSDSNNNNKEIIAVQTGQLLPVNGHIKILEVIEGGLKEKMDAIKKWRAELGL